MVVIIGVLLLPWLLASWHRFVAQQPPGLPQELTRASHGAGMVAFALLATFGGPGVFSYVGARDLGGFIRALAQQPEDPAYWIPAAVWAVVLVWGLNWLIIGMGRTRSPVVDARLMSGAVAKFGVAVVLWFVVGNGVIPRDWSPAIRDSATFAVSAAALWCAVTGLTKIWLLQRGVTRPNRAPAPHPAPRGRAGNASEAEAHQGMRRQGSRLALDDKEF